MATCKDCIHEIVCISHNGYKKGLDWNNNYTPDMEVRCDCFKNKADVVEVVRCKDCKCYEEMQSENACFCNKFGGYVTEHDYCSRAEKKEGAEE